MSGTDIEVAIANLKVIGSEIDPLYRPARFLLGHAYLLRGDATNAVQVFKELIEEFEVTASHSVDRLRAAWTRFPRFRPRMITFAKRIPIIRRWLKRWADETTYVIGGDLYRAAIAWDEIKKALAEQDQSKFGRAALNLRLNTNLGVLENLPSAHKDAEIAVGRRTSDERTASQARMWLDRLLNLDEIEKVDWELDSLTSDSELLNLESILEKEINHDLLGKALQKVEELKKVLWAPEPDLEQLQNALKEKRWSDAKGVIEGLRKITAVPSKFNLMAILNDPAVDSLGARMSEPFIPVLRLVRHERAYRREPLYLETVYHLALALFLTFENDSILRALEMIDEVQTRRVRPSWPFTYRVSDLEVLIVSLEVQASSYHYSKMSKAGSYTRLGDAEKKWQAALSHVAKSKRRRREIRAAALASMGLLTRHERRHLEEREMKKPYSQHSGKPEVLLHAEMDLYRRSLDLDATSVTHCYLAECLISAGLIAEARSHAVQATHAAPKLQLALEIQKKLDTLVQENASLATVQPAENPPL